MASIAKAVAIIEADPGLADFAGGVPFEEVWVAEGRLGVRFPESYREFLLRFGAGRFGNPPRTIFGLTPGVGDELVGNRPPISDPRSLDVVWATEEMREADDFFPADLVVIEDTGEGDLLCLATSRLSERRVETQNHPVPGARDSANGSGECPVVQWIPEMSFEEQAFEVVNSTFAHYLLGVVRGR